MSGVLAASTLSIAARSSSTGNIAPSGDSSAKFATSFVPAGSGGAPGVVCVCSSAASANALSGPPGGGAVALCRTVVPRPTSPVTRPPSASFLHASWTEVDGTC